jgi:hypothetical protein
VALVAVLDGAGLALCEVAFDLEVGLTMWDGTEGVACFTAGWCLVCIVFVLSLSLLSLDFCVATDKWVVGSAEDCTAMSG